MREIRPRPLWSPFGPKIWSTGSAGNVSARPTLNVPPSATFPLQLRDSGAAWALHPETSVLKHRFNRTRNLCARSLLCLTVEPAPGSSHAPPRSWQPMGGRAPARCWLVNEDRTLIGCRSWPGAGRRGRLFPRWEVVAVVEKEA